MTEPDVVITDYLLSIESVALAVALTSRPSLRPDLQLWFGVFFVATAVASLAGGTVHGFFLPDQSKAGAALWRVVLVSIGVAAASTWTIGARLLFDDAVARRVQAAAGVELIAYTLVAIAITDKFWIAIANYLPSTTFLIIAFTAAYRSDPKPALAIGIAGLALTLAAAGIQRAGISLHPAYFDHNALYHGVQALALFLIYWSARYLVGA